MTSSIKNKFNTQAIFSLLMLALLAWIIDGANRAFAEGKPAATAEKNVSLAPGDATVDKPEANSTPAYSIPTSNVRRIFQEAGPLMYAIALCSILVVAFFLERMVGLRRSRVIPRPFVKRFLKQLAAGELDREQALELCRENGSPVAQVFAGAVRKWGRPGVEVEQGVIDSGERATHGLRRYLRVFYGVATVGPLLGLMGTVLGMIGTFNTIAGPDGQGRAELAGGIAQALLNTAGGLAVAIPASILYVYFVSRVDRLIIDIDELGQQVANAISAEELTEREKKSAAPRARRAA
ncbi:MAG: MotA/TolQ/ExbB proton channel family protein [Pirellulales bacterium]|nr:MotA/TolQ/ExbB proton channel family protein [Pirellulales bacterium]